MDEAEDCPGCGGAGRVMNPDPFNSVDEQCARCGGTGKRAAAAAPPADVGLVPEPAPGPAPWAQGAVELPQVRPLGAPAGSAPPSPPRIRARREPGVRPRNTKLTIEIVREARRRRAAGEANGALARAYGVTEATMSLAIHGKTWRDVEGAIPSQEGPARWR